MFLMKSRPNSMIQAGSIRFLLIENTALTLHSKASGGTQNPEQISVPMAALHMWTHTVTYHSMSDIQPYAEMSVTRAH